MTPGLRPGETDEALLPGQARHLSTSPRSLGLPWAPLGMKRPLKGTLM